MLATRYNKANIQIRPIKFIVLTNTGDLSCIGNKDKARQQISLYFFWTNYPFAKSAQAGNLTNIPRQLLLSFSSQRFVFMIGSAGGKAAGRRQSLQMKDCLVRIIY